MSSATESRGPEDHASGSEAPPGRRQGDYIKAAGRFAPTALYDPFLALTMRQGAWRPQLVERIGTGDVVDVGCGTGTLAIALAEAGAHVTGVDGDEDVLRRARAKEGAAAIDWRQGLADDLPLPDASADAVVCSLLLHHLEPEAKSATLFECRRVLRPGGALHVADWGPPADPLQRVAFFGLQLLDGFSNTADHVTGLLPDLIVAVGFSDVERWRRLRTPFGTLELLSARS